MLANESSSTRSPTPEMIRRAREAAGLSRREAATLTSISPHTFSGWERGRYRIRPDRWLFLLHEFAGVRSERAAQVESLLAEIGARIHDRRSATLLDVTSRGPHRSPRYSDTVSAALRLIRPRPTYHEIAEWTGLSYSAIKSWMLRHDARHHRPMPRYAARLILLELSARVHEHPLLIEHRARSEVFFRRATAAL